VPRSTRPARSVKPNARAGDSRADPPGAASPPERLPARRTAPAGPSAPPTVGPAGRRHAVRRPARGGSQEDLPPGRTGGAQRRLTRVRQEAHRRVRRGRHEVRGVTRPDS
jgi:hypothetical protein